MDNILGKCLPTCQGTLSPAIAQRWGMATKRPLPRHVIATNLKKLLATTGLSAPDVARQAGIDRKTLNNQLHGRYDPRPEAVDKVAGVFGYTCWDLLNPNFDPERSKNGRLQSLIDMYSQADDTGRENILRVAEMAAKYKPQ